MNASRDDAAGKIRVQSNRGGGCQWRREVGPLGRRKAATLTFVEAWNHDNVPEMRERTQQPWAKGTNVVAKKCSQCGTTPRWGRSLIRRGQVVFLIDTQAGKLRLIPAETHDVEGGPFPEEWEYRLTLGGPSRTVTYDFVPAASVLHFRYAADASTPWRGNGPVEVAALAGRLSAETVRALGDESSGPVGRLLGIPVDGADATVEGLKADIKNAAGRVALLETGDWGNAGGDAKVDLKAERFGAEPPASLVDLVTTYPAGRFTRPAASTRPSGAALRRPLCVRHGD